MHTSAWSSEQSETFYSKDYLAQKNYSNVKLNILTHERPVMGEPCLIHARQFKALTGADIEIHYSPFNKLYQEALLGLKTGKYDIIFYGSLWIADFQKYLAVLPEKMISSPWFSDVHSHYKMISSWNNRYYQVPIDGDRHYLQYRKDLIENKKLKLEFNKQFGKELQIPETWKELNLIAQFFHNRKVESGKIISGICEITNKDDLLFSQFIKRAAPYAKHPDVKGGFYFDLDTMEPLINNPGFVEALKDFIESTRFYPKGGSTFRLADVIESFGRGDALFSDCWDDPFIQAMDKKSPVAGNVAAALSPGSKKVWNRDKKKWDYFDKVNHVPYIAWGWTSSVSALSKNGEAAFDYLGFFANKANHCSDMQKGQFGVNPCRKSDLDKDFWINRAGWDPKVTDTYVNTLKKIYQAPNRVMDLRIYQSRQYMHALAVGVFRALTGRDTPKQALDTVAQRWNNLNKRVGIDKQRKAYSQIVKFEDACNSTN